MNISFPKNKDAIAKVLGFTAIGLLGIYACKKLLSSAPLQGLFERYICTKKTSNDSSDPLSKSNMLIGKSRFDLNDLDLDLAQETYIYEKSQECSVWKRKTITMKEVAESIITAIGSKIHPEAENSKEICLLFKEIAELKKYSTLGAIPYFASSKTAFDTPKDQQHHKSDQPWLQQVLTALVKAKHISSFTVSADSCTIKI